MMAHWGRSIRQAAGLATLLGPRQTGRYLVQRLRGGPGVVQLRVRGMPTPLRCRTRGSDIRVFWQVFGRRDCDVTLPAPPRVIVDAGAYVGYTSVRFATRYPGARVVAIEPDPENCALLRENCRGHPNVEVIRGALWHRSGRVAIANPGAGSWAFRVRDAGVAEPQAVDGFDVPDLLAALGEEVIDVLKLDVEGAEEELFRSGADAWLPRVGVVLIEVHHAAAGEAVTRAAKRAGFTIARRGEKLVLIRPSGGEG